MKCAQEERGRESCQELTHQIVEVCHAKGWYLFLWALYEKRMCHGTLQRWD